MNYRHAFHAGSFADVVKHAVLARIVAHLKEKPAAFRVIDTHAGAGLYDLAGPEASRTGEWREGIGKLSGAHRKWPTGLYALWYPIKDTRETQRFARRLARLDLPRMLQAELVLPARDGLRGSSLILVNPPWRLESELAVLLPALFRALTGTGTGTEPAAGHTLTRWLTGER